MTKQGTIYLVGTGPGDPTLMTVKGLTLVREADALVGYTFTNTWLLRQARADAEIFDIGSRTRGNNIPQDDISALLVKLAQQGKTVVRLWPGDPFVYCRASREIIAARQAGVRVEVVPGVSSAIAAPAYGGIPVTDWDVNTGFAVVTGLESKTGGVETDWAAYAAIDTLVILMPLPNLSQIVTRLQTAGRAADTPAAIIQQGTMPGQKRVVTTLGGLTEAVARHRIEEPAIVVVGPVVELSSRLDWFHPGDESPLQGKRVMVTRPAHQAADFTADLRALGAEPVLFPTIEICPVADTDPLDESIRRMNRYDWLVLTSANGVTMFWQRLQALGLDGRALAPVKIAAIGPATAENLTRRGITPDLIPEVYTAEGILAAFDRLGSVAGQRFLLARADIARQNLAEGLLARGAQVDEIPTYRTIPLETGDEPPHVDIITFTSSSTVQGYVNCLGRRSPAEALQNSDVICIGPITAQTAADLGVPVRAVAAKYTMNGILTLLKEIYR